MACGAPSGSANFDDRSFEINDEITLGFKDAATAKRLDAIFEKYCPHCQELELDAWHKRGWGHKLIDKCITYSTNCFDQRARLSC